MKNSIWNRNPAKFRKECKRLRAQCLRIIDGQESVIEGSLNILKYRSWMKEEGNKDWDIFLQVYTSSTHLPIGDVRKLWAVDTLSTKDAEIKGIEDRYRSAVINAARKIRDEYQKQVEQFDSPKGLSAPG